MSTAREEVLRRVRQAVRLPIAGAVPDPGPAPAGDVARNYRRGGDLQAGSAELIDLLVDRLEDYKATVTRCEGSDQAIGAAVSSALQSRGLTSAGTSDAKAEGDPDATSNATSVVTPSGIPVAWLGAHLPGQVTDDGRLSVDDLDAADAVLTGSAVAIAETGTIVLVAGHLCGRRAITLVPDVHVCVVRVADVVETVPEGLAVVDPLLPLTFISGPSATSDIELERVEGVHGPRTLIVVIAG